MERKNMRARPGKGLGATDSDGTNADTFECDGRRRTIFVSSMYTQCSLRARSVRGYRLRSPTVCFFVHVYPLDFLLSLSLVHLTLVFPPFCVDWEECIQCSCYIIHVKSYLYL